MTARIPDAGAPIFMDEQEKAQQLYQAGLLARNYRLKTQAEILLEKSARLGNTDAMCELNHLGPLWTWVEGLLKRAADNGNVKAFEALGDVYGRFGDSESPWFKRAVSYYEFPAEKGDAFAMKKLAEAGNVEAMIQLADIYRPQVDGVIKPKKAKAIKYLTQAFELGSPDLKITACKMLADIYEWDVILYGAMDKENPNFIQAVEWFEKAAALGDFDSMCKLVELHTQAGNSTEAETWQRKADAAQAKVLSEVENVLQNL